MDDVGLGEPGLDVAHMTVKFEQDVVLRISNKGIVGSVQGWSAVGHGLFRIEHGRQDLVIDLHLPTAFFRSDDGVGEDGHYTLTHEPHGRCRECRCRPDQQGGRYELPW